VPPGSYTMHDGCARQCRQAKQLAEDIEVGTFELSHSDTSGISGRADLPGARPKKTLM
jgi:hypothetical protein